MVKSVLSIVVLLTGLMVAPVKAQEELEVLCESHGSAIPVRAAVLTRRYGAVQAEAEVVAETLDTQSELVDVVQTVGWRRYYRRPIVSYSYYGGFYGAGFYGAGWYGYPYGGPYLGGYLPRYYSMGYYGYPAYYAYPYYGGYWSMGYAPAAYSTYYARPMIYRTWPGCFYW